MKPKTFFSVAGALFLLIGTLHLLRLIFSWPFVIGTWEAPLWPSIVATVIAYFLGFSGLKLRDHQ